jgi:hypothetical protein
MKNRFVKEIIDLPPEKRRQVNLGKKKRKFSKYNFPNKDYSREEIIEYVKDRGIKSRKDYFDNRDEGAPSIRKIYSEFGGWGEFRKEVWGDKRAEEEKIYGKVPNDAEYIVNTIAQYELWSARKYEKARKEHPDIIPPSWYIKHHFGRWSLAVYLAKRISVEDLVDRYLELRMEKGRFATYTECKKEGLDLEPLYKIHGGKKQLDKFLLNAIGVGYAK